MAIDRIDGMKYYAVVETNHVNAVRTGEIKAQYPLNGIDSVENGTLLQVHDKAKKVTVPANTEAEVYLHASEERLYDEHLGRNRFRLEGPDNYPKMLKLTPGDIFETNAVDLNSNDYKAANLFGIAAGDKGYIKLVTFNNIPAKTKCVLEVIDWITLPNGEKGVKFLVVQS